MNTISSSSPINSWDNNTDEKTEITSENPKIEDSNKEEIPINNSNVQSESSEIQEASHRPSRSRLILRVWQFVAAIGAFGFQVGASPYSEEPIPFEKLDLLYYGYVVCWISIIWSSFHIFVYLTRRFGTGKKIKKVISIIFDWFLAALFGVCIFYEIATYKCKPGLHNGWCNFFNTGLFFLMSLFLSYIIHALWDIFGSMNCLRS
ncbi:hypothetical protein K501DRAFT_295536 [Backusella circina FSU 941]|nr:hypothetical protein K501DRAFT_295536 [Backusella circina FSU 941]